MDLLYWQEELKKRWQFPYQWGRKQNNAFDKDTNFIYRTEKFADLQEVLKNDFTSPKAAYALNRWYNFWSAQCVEYIFGTQPGVVKMQDSKDKYRDFFIENIPFDHKTSVYPAAYTTTLYEAMRHKKDLIEWLYHNQSQQQRLHWKNRLFIVLYNNDKQHWHLKAEILLLQKCINQYLVNFAPNKLTTLHSPQGNSALSDIIWAIK
ncbi:MAG: hypothetical protein R2798_07790 [Chitinophagales bacterium]|nr:hypothetical protein [Bacteroidota bacterium]MCB9042337.1 hypothetical protein [Chitinophagales bacterium]